MQNIPFFFAHLGVDKSRPVILQMISDCWSLLVFPGYCWALLAIVAYCLLLHVVIVIVYFCFTILEEYW